LNLILQYLSGVRGWSTNVFSLLVKVISLGRLLCMVYLSNCHGLPNKTWKASIGTTSHKTWLLPDFYMDVPSSLSQCSLYGFGWGTKNELLFNQSSTTTITTWTIIYDKRTCVFQNFASIMKMFSLWDSSSGLDWLLRVSRIMSRSSSHAYAFLLFISSESLLTLSHAASSSLLYMSWPLIRMVHIEEHWALRWPWRWHLKHLMSLVQVDATCSYFFWKFYFGRLEEGMSLAFPWWFCPLS